MRRIAGAFIAVLVLAPITGFGQTCPQWTLIANNGPNDDDAAGAFDSDRGVSVAFARGYTWERTDGNWSLVNQSGPHINFGQAMAYDPVHHLTLLHGGFGIGYSNETWGWNGQAWQLLSTTGPAVELPSMVFDAARGVAVLFGGWAAGTSHDTWEWNGSTWTKVSSTGPGGRYSAAMAYDSKRGVTVLVGGTPGSGFYLDDVWEWNGSSWTARNEVLQPSARDGAAMMFDSARNVSVLFGGYGGNSGFNDLWEWDGSDWTKVSEGGPTPRWDHSLIYDSVRGMGVLFAGESQTETWTMLALAVTNQPDDVNANIGDQVQFQCTAVGPGSLTFQWRRDGVPLTDGGSISGSETPTLTIQPVTLADAAGYDVVVENDCGQVTSNRATLAVQQQPPLLIVDGTCPGGGPIRVSWTNATPRGQIALVFAINTGHFVIPSGYACTGTELGLGTNQIQIAYQGSAGSNGSKELNSSAGPNACGGYLQLLDVSTCQGSNAAQIN